MPVEGWTLPSLDEGKLSWRNAGFDLDGGDPLYPSPFGRGSPVGRLKTAHALHSATAGAPDDVCSGRSPGADHLRNSYRTRHLEMTSTSDLGRRAGALFPDQHRVDRRSRDPELLRDLRWAETATPLQPHDLLDRACRRRPPPLAGGAPGVLHHEPGEQRRH